MAIVIVVRSTTEKNKMETQNKKLEKMLEEARKIPGLLSTLDLMGFRNSDYISGERRAFPALPFDGTFANSYNLLDLKIDPSNEVAAYLFDKVTPHMQMGDNFRVLGVYRNGKHDFAQFCYRAGGGYFYAGHWHSGNNYENAYDSISSVQTTPEIIKVEVLNKSCSSSNTLEFKLAKDEKSGGSF